MSTYAAGLLTSCATPAASVPIAASRSACSRRRRSRARDVIVGAALEPGARPRLVRAALDDERRRRRRRAGEGVHHALGGGTEAVGVEDDGVEVAQGELAEHLLGHRARHRVAEHVDRVVHARVAGDHEQAHRLGVAVARPIDRGQPAGAARREQLHDRVVLGLRRHGPFTVAGSRRMHHHPGRRAANLPPAHDARACRPVSRAPDDAVGSV
ncbi:MAG: hypothetical protein K8M05_09605 [Deltaproteobacteria bacterium]|nr:hypothetical protein [Kofleriaceae bacterium]